MARLAKRSSPDDDDERGNGTHAPATMARTPTRISSDSASPSPSPSVSFSSDKENHAHGSRSAREKSRMSTATTSSSDRHHTPGTNKRMRLGEQGAAQDRDSHAVGSYHSVTDTQFYDPEQPMGERRKTRKEFRDLARDLIDSRNEFLAPDSTGIADTISKANELFANIKQTADATLDSRLLVTAGDLSARRAVQNKLGGATRGVDLDEFVSKCIASMNRGPTEADAALAEDAGVPSLAHTRRRRQTGRNDDESGEERSNDDGDELNWQWLGLKAFPNNMRPPCPSWLLGPLSVQKRARKVVTRRENNRRRDPADAVRPDELNANEIERQENANLTSLCRKIYALLQNYYCEQLDKVTSELAPDSTEAEMAKVFRKYHLTSAEGVCMYKFAFNPRSFGQTVENLFYISFLVKDGMAGISQDSQGLASLRATEPSSPQTIQAQAIVKRQAVFHLDFNTWRDIIRTFNITSSVIPHRKDDGGKELGKRGWYG